MNMSNENLGHPYAPYTESDLKELDDISLKQLIWLTGEMVTMIDYESDAKAYGRLIDPYNEGVFIFLTQEDRYLKQVNLDPSLAWSTLTNLLDDLKGRGYIETYSGPYKNVVDLDQIEINVGERKTINDDLFLNLKRSIISHLNQLKSKKSSDQEPLKKLIFKENPCQIIDTETNHKIFFKHDNAKITILIKALFNIANQQGSWIDVLSEGIGEGSFESRSLYDTANLINRKIRKEFNLNEDFLIADLGNRQIKINTLTKSFKIERN